MHHHVILFISPCHNKTRCELDSIFILHLSSPSSFRVEPNLLPLLFLIFFYYFFVCPILLSYSFSNNKAQLIYCVFHAGIRPTCVHVFVRRVWLRYVRGTTLRVFRWINRGNSDQEKSPGGGRKRTVTSRQQPRLSTTPTQNEIRKKKWYYSTEGKSKKQKPNGQVALLLSLKKRTTTMALGRALKKKKQ